MGEHEVPISYIGDTLVSQNWCKYFAKGCNGKINTNKQYQGGSIAMFGDETLMHIKDKAIEAVRIGSTAIKRTLEGVSTTE